MKIMVAGDIHGDAEHLYRLYLTAVEKVGADCIVQVGDYGYWEHMDGGAEFLDMNSQLAIDNDVPLYWIDGNHENHTRLRAEYGPGGPRHELTDEGFWVIRPGVFYIPRGTKWQWEDKTFLGLGGAYSIDKLARLRRESIGVQYRTGAGLQFSPPTGPLTQWWPEEEITREEVDAILAVPGGVDVMFTHDKPRGVNPTKNFKNFPECTSNQDKIQQVVLHTTPKLLIHGHFHYRYESEMVSGDNKYTKVIGLDCNPDPDDVREGFSRSWTLLTV